MESITPCPPDVPGSQLATNADDSAKIVSISKGLPENKTEIRGIFLSAPLTSSTISFSNVEKSIFKVFFCYKGA